MDMIESLTNGSVASGVSLGTIGRKWRDAIRRHELVAFFVLAFVLSWYPWVIALARGWQQTACAAFANAPASFSRQSGRSGICRSWATSFRCR
jgi:hypothetical protein